ncbi:uncharacterized protein JCM6883_006028 [Sporobolomyces salmoneus]|uniref:uncharacterized protein n=1 Tax=Sporobolomyces salmoneus TaxID=183962 RepID=UPI00317B2891
MTCLSPLPAELLRDIIESTVPHSFHSTTYQERQSTLYSLSLVSRQFRAIAQPLLCEIASIETDDELELFVDEQDDFGGLRELVLQENVSVAVAEHLLGKCTNLRSLLIARDEMMDPINPGVLAQPSSEAPGFVVSSRSEDYAEALHLSELVNLQIEHGHDSCIGGPFTSLRSLTFDWRSLHSVLPSLLEPEVLPSLRALGMRGMSDHNEHLQHLNRTGLARLLPQLEAIVVDGAFYRLVANGLLSGYSHRILVDIDAAVLDIHESISSLASAHHLRVFIPLDPWDSRYGFRGLKRLRKLINVCEESKTSSLNSIYLDLAAHPSRLNSVRMIAEIEKLMKDCKRAGIELVFDTEPKDQDNYISNEFWERQRRRREKE